MQKMRSLLEKILDDIPLSKETGIMLSGGLDSSAVTCILLKKGRVLRTISASFRGWPAYDETKYIEMIKNKYPQLEINYVTPIEINLLDKLRELIKIIKEPIISGSPLLEYLIMKRAKELGMKNLIYCQWPDELMGGYDRFLIVKAKENFRYLKISNAIINIGEYIQRSKMVGTDLILLRMIKTFIAAGNLRVELNKSIPNIKHLINIAQKMANALEINLILPYGEQEIIEFCQTLPSDRLVYRGQTKLILREAVADVLPKEILERREKIGFFAPDAIWLLQNKKEIENIDDKRVKKEYRKFLRNPKKGGIKIFG